MDDTPIQDIINRSRNGGSAEDKGYQGYITSKEQCDRMRAHYQALNYLTDEIKPSSLRDLPANDDDRNNWIKKIFEAITDFTLVDQAKAEAQKQKISPLGDGNSLEKTASERTGVVISEAQAVEEGSFAPNSGDLVDSNDESEMSEDEDRDDGNQNPDRTENAARNQAAGNQDQKTKKPGYNRQENVVNNLKSLDVELIAHEILILTEDAHQGKINYAPWSFDKKMKDRNSRIDIRYESFGSRMNVILDVLRQQKNVTHKFINIDPKMRFVATPSEEYKRNKQNNVINAKKGVLIKKGRQAVTGQQEEADKQAMPPPKTLQATSQAQTPRQQRKPFDRIPSTSQSSRSKTPSKRSGSSNRKGKGKALASASASPSFSHSPSLSGIANMTSRNPSESFRLRPPRVPAVEPQAFFNPYGPLYLSRSGSLSSLQSSVTGLGISAQTQTHAEQTERETTKTSRGYRISVSSPLNSNEKGAYNPRPILGGSTTSAASRSRQAPAQSAMDSRTATPAPAYRSGTSPATASGSGARNIASAPAPSSRNSAAPATESRTLGAPATGHVTPPAASTSAASGREGKEKGRQRDESKSPPEGITPNKKKVKAEEEPEPEIMEEELDIKREVI